MNKLKSFLLIFLVAMFLRFLVTGYVTFATCLGCMLGAIIMAPIYDKVKLKYK